MMLLAAALLVVCGRAPDYDADASTGRYELKFTAQGDFEFALRNNRLELEVFDGQGPAGVVCAYTQRVPPAVTYKLRVLEGATKPKLSGERLRFEKANGAYEVWWEWTDEHTIYRSPRPNSALPNTRLRPASTDFDNKLEGSATLTALVKSTTTVYVRGSAVHTSPPLPQAKLELTQPMPSRTLARFKPTASGCKLRIVERPEAENGFTTVLTLIPPERPRECVLSLAWKR